MSVAGFFLLIALAIVLMILGNKLVPVIMPSGKRKTFAAGFLGSLAGTLVARFFWQFGPEIAEIYLVGALIGSVLFILGLGIFPYIKILFKL
jgi:uncharacterized membrane protein YeaQ/YmgE (transglycosylase-associated protein family)